MSDLFKGDLQLSSPPNIYYEVKKVIEDYRKSTADAAYLIEKDAALAMRLLKIVNSAFYGFPAQIASIDRAIPLIGTKELQSIILSTVVIDRFSDLPSDLISMHDFWARNLRSALIAQEIDSHLGSEHANSIFICGLLHNIGQLVFFRRIPELAREVNLLLLAHENPSDSDEISIEENIIGFNHYQTGAELSKLWNLPDIITESIRLHSYPDNTESYFKISAIVRLADYHSKLDDSICQFDINSLDISPNKMSELIDCAYEKFDLIFKLFYP
ncbi:MAG: HDOD domain-containing protein [Methylococcales bacterium]|nr:HDOD domain-containing protein [Methylococcales bacterium]